MAILAVKQNSAFSQRKVFTMTWNLPQNPSAGDLQDKILPAASEWVYQAAAAITAIETQGAEKMLVTQKSSHDVVTSADHASEAVLRDCISKNFPLHNLLLEESGLTDRNSEWTWLVDPLDGTVNFSRGIPLWGISLALHHKNQPVLGIVFLPRLGELYCAVQGFPATCNNKSISVSQGTKTKESLVSNGDFNVGQREKINAWNLQNFAGEAENFRRVKCFGSAAVESAWVAAGKLDAYVMTMSYPWDTAAGSLLVTQAGGQVTGMDGQPLQFIDGESVLFSNGIIHKDLLEICSVSQSSAD